jgi:2,4-dienoyl-CoA reductase-like NADH-dependent reductase (Old Yellow Enzyme family)
MRFPLETAKKVRAAVPENLPVFVRISATDWTENGWDLEQSIEFCRQLKEIGIDLIDVSTGGNVPRAKIPVAPNYQVPFAAEIRKQVGIKTAAVGMITEPTQAEEILQKGEADAVLLAREFLREPYFPFLAAKELGEEIDYVPKQYGRAIQTESASEVKGAGK